MITAVDTNILLDLLVPLASHSAESRTWLDESYALGSIIISEVVFAELAAGFSSLAELELFLSDTSIRLVHSQPTALYLSGEAWRPYTAWRHQGLQCPGCGQVESTLCSNCGSTRSSRQHVLADFLIGRHASTQADRQPATEAIIGPISPILDCSPEVSAQPMVS